MGAAARRDLAIAAGTVVGLSRLSSRPRVWLVAVLCSARCSSARSRSSATRPTRPPAGRGVADRVAHPAGRRRRRVPRRHPARAVRPVARAGAARDRALVERGARPRGAHPRRDRAASTPTDRTAVLRHDPARRVPRVRRRRGARPGRPRPAGRAGGGAAAAGARPAALLAGGDAVDRVPARLPGGRAPRRRRCATRSGPRPRTRWRSRSARPPSGRWRSRASIGPALLTLVFFLWDAFHGAARPPARPALDLADGAPRRPRRGRDPLEPAGARLDGFARSPNRRARPNSVRCSQLSSGRNPRQMFRTTEHLPHLVTPASVGLGQNPRRHLTRAEPHEQMATIELRACVEAGTFDAAPDGC